MVALEHEFSPAVHKMCDVFGTKNVVGTLKHINLEVSPPKYELGTDKVVILPFTPRCGSTFVANLLTNHPSFGGVLEWFLPPRLENLRKKWGLKSHNEVVQRIFDDETPPAFASKCNRSGLIIAAHLGILDQFLEQITFIVLERHDKVAQAVSFHKARVRGSFHSFQPERNEVTPNDFNFDEIYKFLKRFREMAVQIMRLGDVFGRPIQRFWYEDFAEDPEAFLNAVTDLLDLPVQPRFNTQTEAQKMGDAINEEWAERFRAMLAEREDAAAN